MRAGATFIGAFALAIASAACFAPETDRGTSAATFATDGGSTAASTDAGSSGGCADGSSGCPCYGNGTCDAGLECVVEVDLCIPSDCQPGSESCTCVDGQCLGELVCDRGVCGSSGSTGGASATSGPETVSDSATSIMTLTTDTNESGPVDCDVGMVMECTDCSSCAGAMGGPCEAQWNDCTAEPSCAEVVDCCVQTGDCVVCCSMGPDTMTVEAYFACLGEACPACADVSCN